MIQLNNRVKKLGRKDLFKKQLTVSATRAFLLIGFVSFLSSCAGLQMINPFAEIRPEDTEPRVIFIDKNTVTVEPSELPKIKPEQVIASYKRLLARGNSLIREEALRRLADLTMRLAETKLAIDDPATLTLMTPAVKEASFADAAALYTQLLLEFPDYQKKEDVKYQLARAHSLNSDPEKSLAILDQIAISPIKASSYVESQFRRGESYFVRKKYQIAEQAYSEVILKGKGTNFYDKALYKRGWSLFKQSLYPESLDDFFILFERLLAVKNNGQPVTSLTKDLITDTKRVISLAFYNQDGAISVQNFFDKHGQRPYEDQIYDSLAKLYIEQERFQDASDTYLGFIERNPLDTSAPDFHTNVIEIYKTGGFPSLILPAKEEYVVSYGRNSKFWQTHKGTTTEALKPQLRAHLDDISRFYHSQAQISKKPADFLIAAKWYKEILDTFEEPQLDSKYRFLMAEALSEGLMFKQAAKEFEIVAYQNEKSEYSRNAGYRALVAYQSIEYAKSIPNSEKLANVIVSGLQFTNRFPADKETGNILARVAEQQLTLKDVPAAIATSRQLLTTQLPPTKTQIDRALVIIANGLFDLKKYVQAETAITELFSTVKLTKKQKTKFHQRRAEAIYKQAETAKQNGQLDGAIALFLKVGSMEPRAPVAINAHFDAATLMLQTKQWNKSANLFEDFRRKHPKHKLSQGIPEKLALIYEGQENWTKAAKEFQILAENNPDKSLARDGFWHVAELHQKSGSEEKAIAAFKHYVWTYPEPYLLAQEGRNKLVELYKQTGEKDKIIFWRQKLIQSYANAESNSKNNARTRFLAAESKYILSKPLFEAYKRIKLRLPLAKSLKKKKKAMNKALKAYEAVANYQVAKFTSESTHKIGQIYQILSNDLMSSQRPKGLKEDELEEYSFLLEDQALPFEDKAINLFEINAARTAYNIYNQGVKASIESLAKLKPAQYNKQEKMEAIENVSF
ncbi:MAG: tetratricopeptide repeat protein [Kangiellaceae bacterium]|nr:tetratricopeptide repeat protein [Kangiellaceae bacterium]